MTRDELSEALQRITIAQLQMAHEMTTNEQIGYAVTSTDQHDYVKGALLLAAYLMDLRLDDDVDALLILLNPDDRDEFVFANYATDGICADISDLVETLHPGWDD